MAYNYTEEELESFVDGVVKARDLIKSKSPDFLIAPLGGAVPFVDIFCLSDPDYFCAVNKEFPPTSSRFENLDQMMGDWYYNFFKSNFAEIPLNMVSIDEIVGGGSTVRNHNYVEAGMRKFVREDLKELIGDHKDVHVNREFLERFRHLKSLVKYEAVGLMYEGEDERTAKKYAKKRKHNQAYTRLVGEGKIIPIGVKKIITMDNPQLNPLKFSFVKNGSGKGHFIPEIARIEYSNEYLDFLKNVAQYMGVDPVGANPSNTNNFRSFERYLPKDKH